MITTVDGDKKKKGQRVWIVAFNADRNRYEPEIIKLTGNNSEDPQQAWTHLPLCNEMCQSMNKDKI